MRVNPRTITKVVEDAGYKVVSIRLGKHYAVTVEHNNKVARVTLSLTPRTDNWPSWLLGDIRRELRDDVRCWTSTRCRW
jgi:predicted RNA binding protein YcfA (HicA-like mRNA interferase family)